MKNVNKIIEETLQKKMKSMQNESKLRGIIKELILEVIEEEEVNEGLLSATTNWNKVKKNINKASDFKAKKDVLSKAISGANTRLKGYWIDRANAVKDENELNTLIADLDERPGKDLEDKLPGKGLEDKSTGKGKIGAASGAIFRENRK